MQAVSLTWDGLNTQLTHTHPHFLMETLTAGLSIPLPFLHSTYHSYRLTVSFRYFD